jgi:adenine phosphoribosyltransferase
MLNPTQQEHEMAELLDDLDAKIRDVPDFPKPGILFKDITPVLLDPTLFGRVVSWMAAGYEDIDCVVGMESRGFIFAAALVPHLDAGFVPARKQGKLPADTIAVEYDLEYGSACLEVHSDAIRPGQRVLIVDDLLATGGTAAATIELVERLGGVVVGCCFMIELDFLNGAERLTVPVRSLIHV